MPLPARSAPSPSLRKLIAELGDAGEAIIAYSAGGLSANLCGHLRLARDGEDPDALRLSECDCHFHIDWRALDESQVELVDMDVGYGPEPTLRLGGEDEGLRIHFKPESAGRVRDAFAAFSLGGDSRVRSAAAARIAPVPVTDHRPQDPRASDSLLSALGRLGLEIRFPGDRDWRQEAAMPIPARAALFEQAWSDPDVSHLWAGLGGYGAGPFVRELLPRLRPPPRSKMIVGASDVSQLGLALAAVFPEAGFLHAFNFEDEALWSIRSQDLRLLLSLLTGLPVPSLSFTCPQFRSAGSGSICGPLVPVNATSARSLATTGLAWLPEGAILFLEDVNETVPRLARLFDDLLALRLLDRVAAIVLGNFHAQGSVGWENLDEELLLGLVAERAACPLVALPEFGHGRNRLPLPAGAPVQLRFGERHAELTIGYDRSEMARAA